MPALDEHRLAYDDNCEKCDGRAEPYQRIDHEARR